MPNRLLYVAALSLLCGSALAQDKTLTFDNSNPATTIHLLNGTSVSIGTNGNLVAKCVLNGLVCADVGSGGGGGGGNVPSVSLAASNFSTTANQSGAYSAGTTFTLTPTVTNASVCWRRVTAGPISGTWTGAIASNLSTAVTGIALGTASTSYTFSLDCYNVDGGSHAEFTVSTSATTVPPPTAGCPDSGWVPTLAAHGFTQATTPNTWLQLQGSANFPSSEISSSSITVPKATQSGLVFLGSSRAKYISVQFTTPSGSDSGDLAFNASQVPGTSAAHIEGYYLTISRCPGDFRYAITSPQDSSEANSCKNMRKSGGSVLASEGIAWNLSGVSTSGICGLQPSTTYYLNYANVNPDDGFTFEEHLCPSNITTCGVQFKAN